MQQQNYFQHLEDLSMSSSNSFEMYATQVTDDIGYKNWQCKICRTVVKKKDTLRKHIITHTKEKPFHCNYCPYRSGRKEGLKRHMLFKHNANI